MSSPTIELQTLSAIQDKKMHFFLRRKGGNLGPTVLGEGLIHKIVSPSLAGGESWGYTAEGSMRRKRVLTHDSKMKKERSIDLIYSKHSIQ